MSPTGAISDRPGSERQAAPSSVSAIGPEAWQGATHEFLDFGYRHSRHYADAMAARVGGQAEHVAVRQDGKTIALASVRIKRLPLVRTGVAYVSGGPLVRHRADAEPRWRLEAALKALREEYVGKRGLVLRVVPPAGEPPWNAIQESCFAEAGFKADPAEVHQTVMISLDRPLTEIRAGFAQKWRNCLNKAERADLRLAYGTDPNFLERFSSLFDEFVDRKELAVDLDVGFYLRLQRRVPANEHLTVFLAETKGELAAGLVISMLGDTPIYLLGASNEAGRRTNASYLLQWWVIQHAAELGFRMYDLGGTDAERNPGVHRFKVRMGGEAISVPGPFEMSPGIAKAMLTAGAENAYRRAQTFRSSRAARRGGE